MINLIIILSSTFIIYSILISIINLFWKQKNSGINTESNLSILIPARNEEKNLPRCLNSIIKSETIFSEIIIYNDHSTDGTEEEIIRYEKIDSRIKKAKTKKLKPGWTGKSYACYQLAKEAKSEWILFIDADTTSEGDLSQLITEAKTLNVTMLSAWPKIIIRSIPEILFMPLLNFIVFTMCPLVLSKKIASSNLGIAHGACILFSKEKYIQLGGHKLVKADLFEDTRLARIWRIKKEKTYCIDGSKIISVRMYDSFSLIWNGFKKNYYPSFSKDLSFHLFQLTFFISYLIIPISLLIFIIYDFYKWISLIFLILNFVPRMIINLKFNYGLLSVLLHPFSIFIMLLLGFNSWWSFRYGKGLEWKKRFYEKK